MNIELTRIDYDFVYLSAVGVAGGVSIAWRCDLWSADLAIIHHFSITMRVSPLNSHGKPWWITNVYAPLHMPKRTSSSKN